MKLRTSLAAAATATAVMVSGTAVADAAPTVNDTAESNSKDPNDKNSDKKTIGDSLSSSDEEGSSIEDMSPEELKSWIAVVTAIVGMLTQVLSIAAKFAR
ncbi:hypothetical protein MHJ98_10130 [Corynebacterium afermentans]|uniref:hypothetical protein n=1 Tax=Corynebacterium afermentans TaxID=38286 RepID=UPI00257317B3|nr:hypothetical protein [Corynebacterium afermentans]MCG7292690.1 hypothetical protein [Corynebacterium afermentans]